eukprot:jgi/Ulvmu1/5428/UM022_0223.1
MIFTDPSGTSKIEVNSEIEIGCRSAAHPLVLLDRATFSSPRHPVIRQATGSYVQRSSRGKEHAATCPRCLAWEKEGCPTKYSCNFKTLRASGGTKAALPFKREPARVQILSKYSTAALRAGALPALLPFHSRLFRRAHHTTRQARRWVVQNLSKASIKATHPRCDLCSPSAPCLLPYWGYHPATRTTISMLRLEAVRRGQQDTEHFDAEQHCDQLLQSGIAENLPHGRSRAAKAADATNSSLQADAAVENNPGTQPSQALDLSCVRGGQRTADGSLLRGTDVTQHHSPQQNRPLMPSDSCESWQMVPAQDDTSAVRAAEQVRHLVGSMKWLFYALHTCTVDYSNAVHKHGL